MREGCTCPKALAETTTRRCFYSWLSGQPNCLFTLSEDFTHILLYACRSPAQGGFPTGMITELVGPAGIGKTQTCLMLAAQACLPSNLGGLGEDAGVVYVDTERKVTNFFRNTIACIFYHVSNHQDGLCVHFVLSEMGMALKFCSWNHAQLRPDGRCVESDVGMRSELFPARSSLFFVTPCVRFCEGQV